jgi:YHS domain-containing protein
MGFLVRLVGFVLIVFLLRYVYAKLFSRSQVPSSGPPLTITGQAHKDPECGIYVAEELAIRAAVNGRQHYFCSAECRDRFLEKS